MDMEIMRWIVRYGGEEMDMKISIEEYEEEELERKRY